MEVIIKIKLNDSVIARMKKGEYVQGSLHFDEKTGEKAFTAYARKSRTTGYVPSYKTIAELENGWLKETKTLIIRREAFQKRVGTPRIMAQMDRGNQQAKDVLIDREIIEFC
ncbi:hypothetical protein [Xylanibacter brevis]|uniref:hypothetical protein n=1 Tax=Xylanibacter brevis TaxID=83231 RepID=UPI00048038F2|nr:hypothetical protein [Xylanibacter brevis]